MVWVGKGIAIAGIWGATAAVLIFGNLALPPSVLITVAVFILGITSYIVYS